jgi:hypothetical protein
MQHFKNGTSHAQNVRDKEQKKRKKRGQHIFPFFSYE